MSPRLLETVVSPIQLKLGRITMTDLELLSVVNFNGFVNVP